MSLFPHAQECLLKVLSMYIVLPRAVLVACVHSVKLASTCMPKEGFLLTLVWVLPVTGTETEEEVERAFQHSVQSTSDPAPTRASIHLTAAVHDMDIDHLLQKLICGEIEYNPHDLNRCAPGRKVVDCLPGF